MSRTAPARSVSNPLPPNTPKSYPLPARLKGGSSYLSQTMCFEKEVVQGFLRKKPQASRLWQPKSKLIQRYFILDHKSETMQIFEKNEPTSRSKAYHYSDVLALHDEEDASPPSTIRLRWSFKFLIKCKQRNFELYCASEDERAMWLYAFSTVLQINNRNKLRIEKQQKTAEKFKLLDHHQKAMILQKTFKLKQEYQHQKLGSREIKEKMNDLIIEEVRKIVGSPSAKEVNDSSKNLLAIHTLTSRNRQPLRPKGKSQTENAAQTPQTPGATARLTPSLGGGEKTSDNCLLSSKLFQNSQEVLSRTANDQII